MRVLNPSKTYNGHKFFTKWVEVITSRNAKGRHDISCMHKNILCKFGIPYDIISDSLKKWKAEYFCRTHYIPRDNDKTKTTNNILIKILERTVTT